MTDRFDFGWVDSKGVNSMNYQRLYSEICKLEGKKLQVSKANVAEVIKCLCILESKKRARTAAQKGDSMYCYRMSTVMRMIDRQALRMARKELWDKSIQRYSVITTKRNKKK